MSGKFKINAQTLIIIDFSNVLSVFIKVTFGGVKVQLLQLKDEVTGKSQSGFDHFDVQL